MSFFMQGSFSVFFYFVGRHMSPVISADCLTLHWGTEDLLRSSKNLMRLVVYWWGKYRKGHPLC